MPQPQNIELNLAGPCGYYCGACRHYLARTKGLLKEKQLKDGCKGCRIQNKKCAWVKRDCERLKKNQVTFCFECPDFPCQALKKFDERHQHEDQVSPIQNLLRIQAVGAEQWLKEQAHLYTCPQCGGKFCVVDQQCYDCDYKAPRKK
jgi:hypothetical protein